MIDIVSYLNLHISLILICNISTKNHRYQNWHISLRPPRSWLGKFPPSRHEEKSWTFHTNYPSIKKTIKKKSLKLLKWLKNIKEREFEIFSGSGTPPGCLVAFLTPFPPAPCHWTSSKAGRAGGPFFWRGWYIAIWIPLPSGYLT
jgi:hypothetical protein